MLSEERRALLVLNGIGLLVTAALTGWLYFFFVLRGIELWPFIRRIPVDIGGTRWGWNMAHLEGITNGLILLAFASAAPYLKLGPRQQTWFFYASLSFAWMFTLPAIANALFGTRGLALGGGPFGPSLANDIIFLTGWPAMIGVHIAFPLALIGAWKHCRERMGSRQAGPESET
jgi:hypothetical protein